MRAFLLASTCIVTLASAASAETSLTTKVTTPVRTATANQGAADDVRITSTGSIALRPVTGLRVDIGATYNDSRVVALTPSPASRLQRASRCRSQALPPASRRSANSASSARHPAPAASPMSPITP
ncbi:hypothetical protein [Sandaracinobacteroides hominis]|uniref:hypothetical protein n=1 Tax=Sandaracinobacteroides hominis TaxID=2780086 RepID=UPI0018F2F9A7|nr:hypothetical protein [Sandaracinobacteroides hominis]